MQPVKFFFEGLLQPLFLLPFIWFARRDIKPHTAQYIIVFLLLFLVDSLVSRLLNISVFSSQKWNWVGKSASMCWALLFIFSTKLVTGKETGCTLAVRNKKSVILIIAALLFVRLSLQLIFHGFSERYAIETFLYEATLPGISEEIVFRGIFLALLNRVFIPKWTFMQTRFGWGLILTSILFGLVHSLTLNSAWIPEFNSQRFVMTGALGFVLGFIKERSESLAPGIVSHNLWNIIAYWGR